MNSIGISKRSPDRPAGGKWCGDPAAWRFVLVRHLPALAALNLLWEVAQLPLYTLWTQAPPAYIAYKHIGPLTHEFVRDKLLPMIEGLRK